MNRFVVWLYTLNTPFLVIATLAVFVAFGVAGLLIMRRLVRNRLAISNEVAICMISCASLIYALILGLIAVATWEIFNKVDETAGQEAFSVGNLYRDLASYPQEPRDHLRGELTKYMQNVIEVEWPLQQCGKSPDQAAATLVDGLVLDLGAIEPQSEGQKLLQAQALAELNQFLAYRRSRVQAVHTGLPPIMWVTLLLGGVLNILLAALFSVDKLHAHVLLVTTYSAMIGLVIVMIISMDRPLLGSTSVSSEAYERILTDVMHSPPIANISPKCH